MYDAAAKVFTKPFFLNTDAMAIRSFSDAVNNGDVDSFVNSHPEQFSLFKVGEFDDIEGVFIPIEKPELLGNGLRYVKSELDFTTEDLFNTVEALQKMVEELRK